jgi:uncharacterized protein
MFQSAYSLLSLFDSVEKINGRKKLQKMIHLFEVSGLDLPFKYEYHHFGPFSAELQEEINFLVNQGMLNESKEDAAYVYNITEKGKEFKEKLKSEENYTVSFKGELLEAFVKENSQFLEIVSTYAYLLDTGYEEEYAKEKAMELKPHLSKYIDSAIDFYKVQIKSQ